MKNLSPSAPVKAVSVFGKFSKKGQEVFLLFGGGMDFADWRLHVKTNDW